MNGGTDKHPAVTFRDGCRLLNLDECRGLSAHDLMIALRGLPYLRSVCLNGIPEVSDSLLTGAALTSQLTEVLSWQADVHARLGCRRLRLKHRIDEPEIDFNPEFLTPAISSNSPLIRSSLRLLDVCDEYTVGLVLTVRCHKVLIRISYDHVSDFWR